MSKRKPNRNAPAPPDSRAQATPSPSQPLAALASAAGTAGDSSPAAASDASTTKEPTHAQNAAAEATPAAKIDAGNASDPASHSAIAPKPQAPDNAGQPTPAAALDTGNVPAPSASSAVENKPRTRVRYPIIRDRLMELPQWPVIIETVRNMRGDQKLKNMPAEDREQFIWGELDRLYQPIAVDRQKGQIAHSETDKPSEIAASSQVADRATVRGLGDIPPEWPELPANASMAAEIGWVQAERLRIVEEKPGGGTVVSLAKARSPAPSWAALSWLETSIRSYAKYVEVAAKVASAPDDEQAEHKRERVAIEEIRGLLREMAGNPPGPGR